MYEFEKPECFFFFFLQLPDYEKEIDIMKTVSKEEYLASLRRYLIITLKITFITILNITGLFILLFTEEAVVFQEVYPNTEELQGNRFYNFILFLFFDNPE